MEYLSLSRRQLQCLALVASGKDARESAAILGLPPCTIEQSLEEARVRLRVGSVQCAADVAERLGLLASRPAGS
jgi:DNA-binding CsgD family transcriptional regulator